MSHDHIKATNRPLYRLLISLSNTTFVYRLRLTSNTAALTSPHKSLLYRSEDASYSVDLATNK